METFLGGLALMAVSGITLLAYRHRRFYEKLWVISTGLSVIVMLLVVVYQEGINAGITFGAAWVPPDRAVEFLKARNEIDLPIGKFLAAWIGTNIYLFLLQFIPTPADK